MISCIQCNCQSFCLKLESSYLCLHYGGRSSLSCADWPCPLLAMQKPATAKTFRHSLYMLSPESSMPCPHLKRQKAANEIMFRMTRIFFTARVISVLVGSGHSCASSQPRLWRSSEWENVITGTIRKLRFQCCLSALLHGTTQQRFCFSIYASQLTSTAEKSGLFVLRTSVPSSETLVLWYAKMPL